MKIPERQKLPTRYKSPGVKECVLFTRYPITSGPTNPPRLPSELISPIDAAAADSLRKVVGKTQNAGWNAKYPAPTRQKNETAMMMFVPRSTVSSRQTPHKKSGAAACHRRSQVLSECQPLSCCARNPTT